MATETMEAGATEKDGIEVIARVTVLLEAAADRCLSIMAADAPSRLEDLVVLSDLGLGARLAADRARNLLPADRCQLGTSSPGQDDPVELVRAAEALTRTVPVEALPQGSSNLIVAVCDLLREHR